MEKILTVSKGLLPAALLPSLVQAEAGAAGVGAQPGCAARAGADSSEQTQPPWEGGVPDALDWDWGTTGPHPTHQNQNGEHLPNQFPGPGQVGSSCAERRAEVLHPRQTENPCPAMKGEPSQDSRDQQMLPHRPPIPAPQAWRGQGGPRVTLHPWVPSSPHQQGCHGSQHGGGGWHRRLTHHW